MRPEMTAVKTVAYIPRTIKGHGVLIALACDQIVMHPEAEIGEASIDEDSSRAINPKIVSAYQETVRREATRCHWRSCWEWSTARLEVLKVETDQGTEFVLGDELDALKKEHTIISQETIVPSGVARQLHWPRGPRFRPAVRERCRCARPRPGIAGCRGERGPIDDRDWRPVMRSDRGADHAAQGAPNRHDAGHREIEAKSELDRHHDR